MSDPVSVTVPVAPDADLTAGVAELCKSLRACPSEEQACAVLKLAFVTAIGQGNDHSLDVVKAIFVATSGRLKAKPETAPSAAIFDHVIDVIEKARKALAEDRATW